MTVRVRAFDPGKAIEAVLLVASKVSDPTFHKISKILYFADKVHLGKYGRLICGDDYVAMRHGPVPSRVYDILKAAARRGESPWAEKARAAFEVVNNYTIMPQRSPDLSALSASESACLEEAIRAWGSKSFSELTNASHDAAWRAADENDVITVEDIARTLPNAEEVLEYVRG
jgi:uncharacterized phage-associated protein